MKLCYLQTAFYIVFLTALITRHRRGISQKTFAFLIILSLVGCAVSLTLGDYTHPAWIGAEYSSAPAETRWRDFARLQTHHRRIWQENYPQ